MEFLKIWCQKWSPNEKLVFAHVLHYKYNLGREMPKKGIFLYPFFRKTRTKIKILIPTFFGQNLYLTNPQVSFRYRQNWGTSLILKFSTIFQFFVLKTLKMVKKFQNFHWVFLFTTLPTDWNSSGSDMEKKR